MLYDLTVAATDERFAIAKCWKTGCNFEDVGDIRAQDHRDKDAIRECGITNFTRREREYHIEDLLRRGH
jgi:hypothetical protein